MTDVQMTPEYVREYGTEDPDFELDGYFEGWLEPYILDGLSVVIYGREIGPERVLGPAESVSIVGRRRWWPVWKRPEEGL